MRKLLLFITILILILSMSCTSNIIYVEKHVYIFDGQNWVEVTGSELKDNTASQSANGELDLPLP